MTLSGWLPAAAVGASFTTLGLLKVYGLATGRVGGGCKPIAERVCGTCPSWSRSANIAFIALLLAIGLGNLAWLVWLVIGQPA